MQLVYVHNINNTKYVFLVADNTYFLYSAIKSAKHSLFLKGFWPDFYCTVLYYFSAWVWTLSLWFSVYCWLTLTPGCGENQTATTS